MTSAWQPIETAPRDGTDILVCGQTTRCETYMECCGFYNGKWPVVWMAGFLSPTHWMPLPSPPEQPNAPDHNQNSPAPSAASPS